MVFDQGKGVISAMGKVGKDAWHFILCTWVFVDWAGVLQQDPVLHKATRYMQLFSESDESISCLISYPVLVCRDSVTQYVIVIPCGPDELLKHHFLSFSCTHMHHAMPQHSLMIAMLITLAHTLLLGLSSDYMEWYTVILHKWWIVLYSKHLFALGNPNEDNSVGFNYSI